MSYSRFTTYYDEIVRGNWYSLQDEVNLLCELIGKFWNGWKSILEFACGSGVVAKGLQSRAYEVRGVDMSESMLEKARENMWEHNCYVWDMMTYASDRKHDVVLCNYNSICHLTNWENWKKLFSNACKNLSVWWVLIFDINTVQEFESIMRDFAQFYTIWDDTVCLEMQKKWWIYEWIIKMFVKNKSWYYDLFIETIPETSFEIGKIQDQLAQQWFKNLHLEDFHKWVVDDESERVYFIAQKK